MDSDLRAAIADHAAARWWTYKLPPVLERRFVSETDAELNHRIRFWVAICLAFSWITFAFDLKDVPEAWRIALLLRLCVVTPVSLVAMRLLGSPQPGRWLTTFATVAPPAIGHLTILLVFAASAVADSFRSGIVLVLGILWINVLIPMRLRDTLAFTLVTLVLGAAINITAAFAQHATLDHPDVLVICNVFIALSVLARFLAERDSRRGFVVGLRLQSRADELARSNAKLLEMSSTDPLTGLANRRCFDQTLAQAWQEGSVGRSSVALMMIDIDHFKKFNDAAGHLEGDRCLTIIARGIVDNVRAGCDLVARFGGEEFVVLMPRTQLDEAHEVAERLRAAIAAMQVFHPGRIGRGFVSVSIGVAAMQPNAAGVPATLIAAADEALYAAKAAGRDRVISAGRRPRQAEAAA